ncbi:hypothetical protein FXF69_19860 [Actinomadura chibensis]|uniref:Uncharacterized protein n=1 Tax=Actinomadura chibensis TaxID=392828 RepID=A0A5D0NMC9_9ACTN|nr:hypothetical protein FXF69_19860 [Actinomadura chibensis]
MGAGRLHLHLEGRRGLLRGGRGRRRRRQAGPHAGRQVRRRDPRRVEPRLSSHRGELSFG